MWIVCVFGWFFSVHIAPSLSLSRSLSLSLSPSHRLSHLSLSLHFSISIAIIIFKFEDETLLAVYTGCFGYVFISLLYTLYRFIIRPINFDSMTYVSNWISYMCVSLSFYFVFNRNHIDTHHSPRSAVHTYVDFFFIWSKWNEMTKKSESPLALAPLLLRLSFIFISNIGQATTGDFAFDSSTQNATPWSPNECGILYFVE